jgi:hypothetical protein
MRLSIQNIADICTHVLKISLSIGCCSLLTPKEPLGVSITGQADLGGTSAIHGEPLTEVAGSGSASDF